MSASEVIYELYRSNKDLPTYNKIHDVVIVSVFVHELDIVFVCNFKDHVSVKKISNIKFIILHPDVTVRCNLQNKGKVSCEDNSV